MKRYKQPKIDTSKKSGSIAFFLALPTSFILGALAFYSTAALLVVQGLDGQRLALFAAGCVVPIGFLSGRAPSRAKTLIHELKHAFLVVLSGNKLTEMKVARDLGHVSYELYESRARYGPFIILAPYFFPMFSLPALACCIVLEIFDVQPYLLLSHALLGAAVAADILSAVQEFHPHQSDLQRIWGGRVLTYLFLAGANFCWVGICALWLQSGVRGYLYAGHQLVNIAAQAMGMAL